jgi:uncharacterized protein (TIGR02246 family)
MKKAPLVILSVLVAAAATTVPARAADSGAKAEIERLSGEFVAGWNAHDARKMAAVWTEDGDLINPFGQSAKGRAEIEKFFEKEQATVMKGTTYKIESSSIRELDATCAIADWTAVVTGMTDAGGRALPPFNHHVVVAFVKKGGHWHAAAIRAYGFETPPGAAPAR